MMQILMYAGRSRGVDTSARRPCIFSASFRGDQGGASSCARHGRLCEKLPGICTRGLRKSGTQRGGQRDCAREENRANAPKRRDMTGDRSYFGERSPAPVPPMGTVPGTCIGVDGLAFFFSCFSRSCMLRAERLSTDSESSSGIID